MAATPTRHRLGHALLYAGAAVCVLGGVGFAFGMFVHIPDRVALRIVRAIAYTAPFLLGGTLMLCGAFVLRAAREAREARQARDDATRRAERPAERPALDAPMTAPPADVRAAAGARRPAP